MERREKDEWIRSRGKMRKKVRESEIRNGREGVDRRRKEKKGMEQTRRGDEKKIKEGKEKRRE